MFQAYLRRLYILFDELCSDLTKSQDRLQTLYSSMVSQNQNFNLQMQPQAVSGSDISLSKLLPGRFFVLADLDPDISAGLDTVQGIA